MQPAAQQTMMTVIVTSTIDQNPGGIRHVSHFLTIDFSGRLLFNDDKWGVSDFRNAWGDEPGPMTRGYPFPALAPPTVQGSPRTQNLLAKKLHVQT